MGGNVSGYHYVGIKMEGFGQQLILSCPFMKSTTDIFFIGMSTADDVNFGGRDNGHIAHCDLGRKCQRGRTSRCRYLLCFLLSSLCLKNMNVQALFDGSLLSIRCLTAKILVLE